GGDLGQVGVVVEAGLLDLGGGLGREGVVEVFGDGVGVDLGRAGGGRVGQAAAAGGLLDALDQFLGDGTLGDLLPDLAGQVRLEGVVQVGEQGAERQAHARGLPGERVTPVSGPPRAVSYTIFLKSRLARHGRAG